MNTKSYNNITLIQLNDLLAKAKSSGVSINGNELSTHGVTIVYAYNDTTLTLTIKVKHFPSSFVSNTDIFKQIEKAAGLNA
jgi:hypothetical protein